MTYFKDLSFGQDFKMKSDDRTSPLNVGWLERGLDFETALPEKWLLEKLWAHCRFAVNDMRGYHSCDLLRCPWPKKMREVGSDAPYIPKHHLELCQQEGISPHPNYPSVAAYHKACAVTRIFYEKTLITSARHHHKEQLGYSEIRIFGPRGVVYAAPNLIFHYVRDHHYKMPDQVIDALRSGPCPPEKEWFDRLRKTGDRLDMRQCFRRARRAGVLEDPKARIFDIPTRPVPWIPETLEPGWGKKPRAAGRGQRSKVRGQRSDVKSSRLPSSKS